MKHNPNAIVENKCLIVKRDLSNKYRKSYAVYSLQQELHYIEFWHHLDQLGGHKHTCAKEV